MEAFARLPEHVGVAIRRERRKQKLTQKQLSEMTRLRQATISKLEAGEPGTQLDTILRVLGALGLELTIRPRSRMTVEDFDKFL